MGSMGERFRHQRSGFPRSLRPLSQAGLLLSRFKINRAKL